MTIDHVYQIAPQYYVGPKRERPPASDAEGTVWEVTTPNPAEATRRTLSDGEQWITLSVEPGGLDSPTLDDVFLAITGHPAGEQADDEATERSAEQEGEVQ